MYSLDGRLSGWNGGTLIFCAHNTYQIKKLCGQAVWLHNGRVRLQGAASSVVQEYADFIEAQGRPTAGETLVRPVALTAGENRVTAVRLLNGHAQETSQFHFGQPFRARIRVEAGDGRDQTASDSCWACPGRLGSSLRGVVRYGRRCPAPP